MQDVRGNRGAAGPRRIRRLDTYRHRHNECRPHGAWGERTPEEAWRGLRFPPPVTLRAGDPLKVTLEIRRLRCRGDPRLPVIQILRKAA
jgi:hypothetical protein